MSSPEQLSDLLRRHGVDNDELLDALKWKYRKIYTEKEMVLRERDKLRAELKKLKGDKWEEAGQ
jgi:cell division septum initiation protein DivIVA